MLVCEVDGIRVAVPEEAVVAEPVTQQLSLRVQEDVIFCQYGQCLDIVYPDGYEDGGLYPAVLYIHGGAWRHGTHKGAGMSFALNGFVAFSVEYRFSQEAPHPAQVNDCLAALEWVREHAAEYRVDTNRIFVQGGSSGGHLALMTAMQSEEGAVRACVACCPPTDLPALYYSTLAANWYLANFHAKLIAEDSEGFGEIFGCTPPKPSQQEALYAFLDQPGFASAFDQLAGVTLGDDASPLEAMSPLHLLPDIQHRLPPILLLHGLADPLVPVYQSLLAHEALARHGHEVELRLYEKARHNYAYDGARFVPERTADIIRFFQKYS